MLRSSTFSSRRETSKFMSLFVFVAGIFLVDLALARILEPLLMSSRFRYSMLYSGRVEADVAVFGNSRAVHTFFAPEIGAGSCGRTANFAFNGLSMRVIEALILDYLERNPKPKVVILEISSLYSTQEGSRQLTPYMLRGSRLRELLLSEENTFVPWQKILQSYRFNSVLLIRVLGYMLNSDQTWINRLGPIQQRGADLPKGEEKRVYEIVPENLAAFLRITQALESRSISILPVVAPYHPSVSNQIENPYTWALKVKGQLQEKTGFLDLSKAIPGDDEYRDYLHLNIVGARELIPKINERLLEFPTCQVI